MGGRSRSSSDVGKWKIGGWRKMIGWRKNESVRWRGEETGTAGVGKKNREKESDPTRN